jgi:hypothetical protein
MARNYSNGSCSRGILESASYWLHLYSKLNGRGLQDIMKFTDLLENRPVQQQGQFQSFGQH